MKTTRIKLVSGEVIEVPTLKVQDGLAITKKIEAGKPARGWRVTHLQSGAAFGEFANREIAIVVFKELVALGGWSRTAEEIRRDREIGPKVLDVLRGAQFEGAR